MLSLLIHPDSHIIDLKMSSPIDLVDLQCYKRPNQDLHAACLDTIMVRR